MEAGGLDRGVGGEGKAARGQLLREPRSYSKEVELLLRAKGSFKHRNDRMRFVSLGNPGGRG